MFNAHLAGEPQGADEYTRKALDAGGRAVQYTGSKLEAAGAGEVARKTLDVTERVFDVTEKAVGASLEYTKKAIDVTVVGTKKAVEVTGKAVRCLLGQSRLMQAGLAS